MSREAVLLPEEGQLLRNQDGIGVRIVQARERILPSLRAGWVLWEGDGVAGSQTERCFGTEDFADVVQSLAIGVTRPQRQLLEDVVGTVFHLHALVVGKALVGARSGKTLTASLTAYVSWLLARRQHLLRRWARGQPGRNKLRERTLQVGDEGIAIHRLEEVHALVAHITGFDGLVFGDLPLHAKTPGVNPLRREVGSDIGFSGGSRIEDSFLQKRSQLGPHIRTCGRRQQRLVGGVGPGKGLQEDRGSRGRNVGVNVVERRIVGVAIATAEDSLASAGRVGKACARTILVGWCSNPRNGAGGKGHCRIPERSGGIAFPRGGEVVEKIGRLAVVAPGQAQIQGQTTINLPVVSDIDEGIVLAKVERWATVSYAHQVRCVQEKGIPIGESRDSIEVGQELVGRPLVGPVRTCLNGVFPDVVAPVVLNLPGVHNPSLRKIVEGTKAKVSWIAEGYLGNRLVYQAERRNRITDRVAAKLNVCPAVGHAALVDHPRVEVVRPARERTLVQIWDARRKARSDVVIARLVRVEQVVLVVDVTAYKGVVRPLHVRAAVEVVDVLGLPKTACYRPELNSGTSGDGVGRTGRRNRQTGRGWISSRDAERPKLLQRG